MRIVIPTIGSRGDVQPFIALAQGLSVPGIPSRWRLTQSRKRYWFYS
jgi:hypothetical protein